MDKEDRISQEITMGEMSVTGSWWAPTMETFSSHAKDIIGKAVVWRDGRGM